jgi:hypothetical protein
VKPTEAGWLASVAALAHTTRDANVRAEAANALVSHSLVRAWPCCVGPLRGNGEWLVRCSILSAVAEHPEMEPADLLELAQLALADGDGTVRAGAAEILGRLVREGARPSRQPPGRPRREPPWRISSRTGTTGSWRRP